jgi:hypothetical protein
MSETLTDEHHDWVARVLDVDPRTYPAASGSGGEPSGGGILDDIKGAVSDAASKVKETAEAAVDTVADTAKAVGEKVADTAKAVEAKVEEVVDTVEQKVTEAAKAVGEKVGEAAKAVEETVEGVVKKVKEAFTPPPPVKPGEAGPAQTDRADKLLKGMPPEDQAKVKKLLDEAPPQEKGYLQKALASKHTAAELEEFHKQIAGKDAAWLEKNLHVVGQSQGKGIKQQWHDSCGPTTIQAMKAELDPIYALKLRTENPNFQEADNSDGTKLNPKMADEQKTILTGKGGIARNRDSSGKGMPLTDALNDQTATTGLKFDIEEVDSSSVDGRLGEIDKSVNSGLPVPMRVSDAPNTGGHFVLVVGADPGPPKTYTIHDPWDGKLVKVTDKQIKDNNFNIAGWNKVSHIYKPSAE